MTGVVVIVVASIARVAGTMVVIVISASRLSRRDGVVRSSRCVVRRVPVVVS